MNENSEPITLINSFEVPPDHVDTFVDEWRERAKIMSTAPGFRDFRMHQVISPGARFQFVNVAHWDSYAAWEAAGANPEFRSRVDALDPQVRTGANPAIYRVVAEFRDRALEDE
ncbi:MAG: antibiotic biosynthesis monooxygenase family protein [Pseudonocardiaceae bacterium]